MAKKEQHRKRRGCAAPFFAFIFLLVAAGLFLYWSNNALQTERAEFVSDRLPQSFDGYRIALLSDLHGKEFGADNEQLLSAVAELEPDAVVITGDLADRFRGLDETYAAALADGLSALAPTYYITGNHEWAIGNVDGLKALLSEHGVTPLSNEYVTISRGDGSIVLAGIDDPNGPLDQKTPEALAEEIAADCSDPFWILLAHRNNRFEKEYSLLGADLVLSGHAHGGLIRLPGTDGLISTERTLFPSYTAGFYTVGDATVYVSRGLGNSGPTFRLLNRPELVGLTLRCAAEDGTN